MIPFTGLIARTRIVSFSPSPSPISRHINHPAKSRRCLSRYGGVMFRVTSFSLPVCVCTLSPLSRPLSSLLKQRPCRSRRKNLPGIVKREARQERTGLIFHVAANETCYASVRDDATNIYPPRMRPSKGSLNGGGTSRRSSRRCLALCRSPIFHPLPSPLRPIRPVLSWSCVSLTRS